MKNNRFIYLFTYYAKFSKSKYMAYNICNIAVLY